MSIDYKDRNKIILPNCINFDLNYANVWDKENKKISQEKANKLGINTKIETYDIDYITLKNRVPDMYFGEVFMLYELIVLNTPNYQKIIEEVLN